MPRGLGNESSHNNVTIGETTEVLEIIKEEQVTPKDSNTKVEHKPPEEEPTKEVKCNCSCKKSDESINRLNPEVLEKILKEREAVLREEYDKRLEDEMVFMKDRFDFIISNEQMRASFMLREAHRERQEKITALQTQLECKNLAGLMYVMCSERRRSKLERLRLIEEYTNYIRALQEILTDGQALILYLSRGYKTATRVDHEWREKMKKIVKEFMAFIYNYTGGPPESNQYFFDLPQLLKTEAPILDNPKEDPCEAGEEEGESMNAEAQGDRTWWESLDGDSRPFVMFGDMAEFKPDQRREVLKIVKAEKTAPRKWKEYVFNEMFLKADCPNSDEIKDVYPSRLPGAQKWECSMATLQEGGTSKILRESISATGRRNTTQSIDIRGAMGSLLKIITSTNVSQQAPKTTLLGARDSMEIQSTTKLRERSWRKGNGESSKVVIKVGKKKPTMFDNVDDEDEAYGEKSGARMSDDDVSNESSSALGSLHVDSLNVLPSHVADNLDRTINYEKACPMEKCQRMQVDSFIRSLPPYMRANPYTHFEQTFEEYETCTPEQMEMLKQRMEARKVDGPPDVLAQCPLDEWTPSVHGVETQTSVLSGDLPPCTCNQPSSEPSNDGGMVFNVEDLVPIKQALECIQKACFFDNTINFDRFKVIGEERSRDNIFKSAKIDFKHRRYLEIRKILKHHPSLLDIFQANTRC